MRTRLRKAIYYKKISEITEFASSERIDLNAYDTYHRETLFSLALNTNDIMVISTLIFAVERSTSMLTKSLLETMAYARVDNLIRMQVANLLLKDGADINLFSIPHQVLFYKRVITSVSIFPTLLSQLPYLEALMSKTPKPEPLKIALEIIAAKTAALTSPALAVEEPAAGGAGAPAAGAAIAPPPLSSLLLALNPEAAGGAGALVAAMPLPPPPPPPPPPPLLLPLPLPEAEFLSDIASDGEEEYIYGNLAKRHKNDNSGMGL